MSFTIEVQGIDELLDKYQQGDGVAFLLLAHAMNDSLDLAENNAQAYPPESEANSPPPPYYKRGIGTQYASFNLGESERLGWSWRKKVTAMAQGLIGELSNMASYAPWVHGEKSQAWFHIGRWRTVAQIAVDIDFRIQVIFRDAAQKLASFLNT